MAIDWWAMRWLLAVALLLAIGCAAPPPRDLPPDVPPGRAVRVVTDDGFRLCALDGCLSLVEERALLDELSRARAWLVERLGTARAPADFRDYGEARAQCPGPPPPIPARIDVVITEGGERCHADADGLTVQKGHLPRRDATHELVHFLAGSSWRPLDEGLAVYLTEELWGPDRYRIRIRTRAYADLGYDDDLDPDALRAGMSRKDYDVAGAFVGWLIDAYGQERFFQLYHGPVRDYQTVYGQGEAALWKRFWRYIRNLDVRHDGAYHAFKTLMTASGS